MAPDSTATSPRGVGQPSGVDRLLVVFSPAADAPLASKVLERSVLITREAASSPAEPERLTLADPEVSRRHVSLVPLEAGAGWELRDEGSHNGTFVNGARIERQRLASGDVIRIGQHLLLFQQLDAAASQRLIRRRAEGSPLIGEGSACKWIDEQISAAAGQSAPVLILGESGTGKELVAKQLHEASGRRGRFVPVNCTALTESMAESELFGHVQGAFSGAVRAREGLFGEAQGGTLLLDELGDMPLAIQAKLLRAIETGEVRKLGSDRAQQLDVRVLGATHVDLERAVREGCFRGDLFARLMRLVVRVPALRERREDVLVLARHFVRASGSRLTIAADAAEALLVHAWPYNVRELRNVVEAALARARGGRTIELEHLPEPLRARFETRLAEPVKVPLGRAPDADELRRILRQHDWNVTRVAALFGRDRKQIYRWCKALAIEIEKRR